MRYIALLLLLLVTGCSSERVKPKVDASLSGGRIPLQESWNSDIVFTDSGKTVAVLNVGHLRMYDDTKETLIDSGMRVDFYNSRQLKTTTLTSRYGKVDDKTKDLYAMGDVVAVNDSGVRVVTDVLIWKNGKQKITTDRFVTITTKYETIQGYGFESDQHLRNYVIFKPTYVTSSGAVK